MKVSFFTFGCTVNNYESQELSRKLSLIGDTITERGDADVIIINSCVITGVAEKSALNLIERMEKKNPDALIILIGCYNEYIKKNGLKAVKANNLHLLDKKRPDLPEEIHRLYREHEAKISGAGRGAPDAPRNTDANAFDFKPARAIVQIHDGCGNDCSYCVVPHVRGGPASAPYDEIERKIRDLTGRGYRDFVIAGLNPGCYDDNGLTLIDVLENINALPGVESLWLSSLEPMNIGRAFIERLPRVDKLNPHLHISLQSGCDRTLSAMNRRYRFEDFEETLGEIRKNMPGASISTDIIVGFPGESERDFEESVENVVKCRFSDIHIFKFSRRTGTAAAEMDAQITEHVKNRRALLLKGVKMQTRYHFYSQFIGKTEKAVLLRRPDDTSWEALTAHNFPVIIRQNGSPGPTIGTAAGLAADPAASLSAGPTASLASNPAASLAAGITSVKITGMNVSQDTYTALFV